MGAPIYGQSQTLQIGRHINCLQFNSSHCQRLYILWGEWFCFSFLFVALLLLKCVRVLCPQTVSNRSINLLGSICVNWSRQLGLVFKCKTKPVRVIDFQLLILNKNVYARHTRKCLKNRCVNNDFCEILLQGMANGWATHYSWRCQPVDTSNSPKGIRVMYLVVFLMFLFHSVHTLAKVTNYFLFTFYRRHEAFTSISWPRSPNCSIPCSLCCGKEIANYPSCTCIITPLCQWFHGAQPNIIQAVMVHSSVSHP